MVAKALALDVDQIDDLMKSTRHMCIATHGPGKRINLTPMSFGWLDGCIYTFGRGQKVVNLRRDPECTVVVDRNEKFLELQGVMFQGQAVILEDVESEKAHAKLESVRQAMGEKYNYGKPFDASVRGRTGRWIVITPDRHVSWDNFKLRNF